MNILIQLPTLGRWEQVHEVLSLFMEKMSGKHQIVFNINCDIDDITMYNSATKEKIRQLFWQFQQNPDLTYKPMYDLHYDRNTTKINSMNAHIKSENFDIIIGASDDMIPYEDGWDDIIAQDMGRLWPELDGCISYSDGRDVGNLVTFSILGKRLYDHFGYIYHPDYKSLYCDNEFTDEVNRMGKIKYIDRLIIGHEHCAEEGNRNSGNRDFAHQKTLQFSGRDGILYQKRKELGFPAERITNDTTIL